MFPYLYYKMVKCAGTVFLLEDIIPLQMSSCDNGKIVNHGYSLAGLWLSAFSNKTHPLTSPVWHCGVFLHSSRCSIKIALFFKISDCFSKAVWQKGGGKLSTKGTVYKFWWNPFWTWKLIAKRGKKGSLFSYNKSQSLVTRVLSELFKTVSWFKNEA